MNSWEVDSSNSDWHQPNHGFAFSDEEMNASRVPVVVALIALIVSVLSLFISSNVEETSSLRVALAISAYVLTPFATSGALVWAMKSHRSQGANQSYASGSGTKVIRFCSVIAILGFIAAIPQIWIVSDYFSLLFGGGMQ